MTGTLKARSEKWVRSTRKILAPLRTRIRRKFRPDHCVIVASNGRSGSTMTYTALLEALKKLDPKVASQARFIARLDDAEFQAPFLYKTHDFPQTLSTWPKDTRVVFCFGPAKESSFSVYSAMEGYGPDWIKEHFYNMHATGTFDELFQRDVLQQARQIREWVTFQDIPVLCVHYDALWDYQKTISRFTGLDFAPPARRARAPKEIPAEFKESAGKVYDPIDDVVAQLPKCFRASAKFEKIVGNLPI